MKWLALFWVYRREALLGWRSAQRKNMVIPMNVTVGSAPYPAWIERPIEVPRWSDEARERFVDEFAKQAGEAKLRLFKPSRWRRIRRRLRLGR